MEARIDTQIRREVEWYRGRWADGGMATFDGPARAIRCAYAMREFTSRADLPLRAALHTGDCDLSVQGFASGFTVEVAGCLWAHAQARQILVSRVVKDLVAGSGIEFEEAGEPYTTPQGERWPLFTVRAC